MRLLLAENDLVLGATIKQDLSHRAYIVDWTVNGIEAWIYLENQRVSYTLVILSWTLPKVSGLELCQRIRHQHQTLPILMLIANDCPETKKAGFDAGVDDFLVKPFRMVELLARSQALQQRSPQLESRQLQIENLTLPYGTRNISCQHLNADKQTIPLTKKEFQLLEYFMRHPNQVVTRDQILDQLWEIHVDLTSNVVAAQIRLLRHKLARISCKSLIETVPRVGYRLNTELLRQEAK